MADFRQLTLDLPHQTSMSRDDYLKGAPNSRAFELIESWPDWPSRVVLLAGPVGSGKTHLAGLWAERVNAVSLPVEELVHHDPMDLVKCGAVLIEDADGTGRDDIALFHLLNAAREVNASVLITARSWTDGWGVQLADLLSRLRAATPVELGEPDDELLKAVLLKLFADRQLIVPMSVIDFVVVRMERSLGAAGQIVDELDRIALVETRSITRPLAARIMSALEEKQSSEDHEMATLPFS
ncbi:MAG: hypothetical protein COB90_03685 [Hyphomicrobiales bacterium]|nr:MAG: hypothetical protein COB90_03685 [Hyphomicrobiales bacterium]